MIKITWSQTSTYSLHISHLPTHSLTASRSFWLQRCMQSLPHRWRVADNEGLHGSLLSPCPQVCGPPLLLLLPAHNSSMVQLFLALYCPAPVLSLITLSKLPECLQKQVTHHGLLPESSQLCWRYPGLELCPDAC